MSREIARELALARVCVERAAAGLASDRDDLDAVAREHPRGRGVRVAEHASHHAALEERDPSALGSLRSHSCYARHTHARRQQIEQIREAACGAKTHRAQKRSGAEPPRRERQHGKPAEDPAVWKEPLERRRPDEALDRRSRSRHDDLRPRTLDELAVFDARGARGLAGAAVQTFRDVVFEARRIRSESVLPYGLHEPDPAAR